MNICFVIDNIFPSHGGVGRTTERFSKKLKEKGHNVILIASEDNVNKPGIQKIDGLKIYRLPGMKIPFTGGIYYQAYPKKSEIEKVLENEKIDVIILITYAWLGAVMRKYAKKHNIPFTTAVHFQPENVTERLKFEFISLKKAISKWTAFVSNQSEEIITPSLFAKKMLEASGVKSKINVISNGICLDDFDPDKVDRGLFRKEFKLNDEKIFLFVGRLMPEKNIQLLLNAFSKIDWSDPKNEKLKLVIVGTGDYEKELYAKTKELKLDDKVLFTGKIDDTQLKRAYRDCDFFILPSLAELEGMVVLEAMAMGAPVLVAGGPGSAAPFLLDEGGNGYVFDPHDADALSKLIIKMSRSDELQKKMANHSLKKIKAYDINKSIEMIEEVLERIINS